MEKIYFTLVKLDSYLAALYWTFDYLASGWEDGAQMLSAASPGRRRSI